MSKNLLSELPSFSITINNIVPISETFIDFDLFLENQKIITTSADTDS